MKSYHVPVLLNESIEGLKIDPNGQYIDCTLGEAGHSSRIYKKLSEKGKLLSIDQDQSAIDYVRDQYPEELKVGNWIIAKGNFSKIAELAASNGIKPNGILMDLGLSSRQLEEKGRGFSYMTEKESLDMRMDHELAVTAKDLINGLNEKELELLFRKYGEERFARKIARKIKTANAIETVGDLTSLIYEVMPVTNRRKDSHHPARRVFQALRIAVNDELNSLNEGLDGAFEILQPRGRLCVISFHSLEDRIVKRFFVEKKEKNLGEIINGVITPSEEEISSNSRARSAKLRIIEKI